MSQSTHYRTCNLCEALCGLEVEVVDNKAISIRGDKKDVFSRGHICPKAVALKDVHEDPDRLKHPVKKVNNEWKRISWDEALDEIAAKLKAVRESGKPEEFAFHQGRQRSKDALKRFLDAFGTKTQLSHRALCSSITRWVTTLDRLTIRRCKLISCARRST